MSSNKGWTCRNWNKNYTQQHLNLNGYWINLNNPQLHHSKHIYITHLLFSEKGWGKRVS